MLLLTLMKKYIAGAQPHRAQCATQVQRQPQAWRGQEERFNRQVGYE